MSTETRKRYSFDELEWDTDFFGVSCAKAVLEKELTPTDWEELKMLMSRYQFVSIVNRDSLIENAIRISKDTGAYIADINIQFEKKIGTPELPRTNIVVKNQLDYNDDILTMANFSASKFVVDPEFRKRNGEEVYRQWLINSFGRKDKYYALSFSVDGKCNGFLLFSINMKVCTLDLAAVSEVVKNKGIGTDLWRACEKFAAAAGCSLLSVGTQLTNFAAVNMYHKYGFRMVACHQVYHLWNL